MARAISRSRSDVSPPRPPEPKTKAAQVAKPEPESRPFAPRAASRRQPVLVAQAQPAAPKAPSFDAVRRGEASFVPGQQGSQISRLQKAFGVAQIDFFDTALTAAVIRFKQQQGLTSPPGKEAWIGQKTLEQIEKVSGSMTGGGTSPSTGQINARGLSLLKDAEGLRLNGYIDDVGVPTIGWGHTGPGVQVGQTITTAEAEQLLKNDLKHFEEVVSRNVKVPLNSNQFSALVSFTFNVGEGGAGADGFSNSTLLRKLNSGDYAGAANEFSRWNKGEVNGQIVELAGLTTRRANERALFLE